MPSGELSFDYIQIREIRDHPNRPTGPEPANWPRAHGLPWAEMREIRDPPNKGAPDKGPPIRDPPTYRPTGPGQPDRANRARANRAGPTGACGQVKTCHQPIG